MRSKSILLFSIAMLFAVLVNAAKTKPLLYKTRSGHNIKVDGKRIYYDGKTIFTFKYDDEVELDPKENHLIEDSGSVLLVLYVNGAPNLDRFNVYNVTPVKAILVADCIASPIKDYDHDGKLEFGGRDLTEMHPSPDSMYYVPTHYFEINKGQVIQDEKLTRAMDIKLNGLYLAYPLDKDGSCCKVIPITKAQRDIERSHRGN